MVCPTRRVDNHGYLLTGAAPIFRAGHNGKPQSKIYKVAYTEGTLLCRRPNQSLYPPAGFGFVGIASPVTVSG